MWKIPLFDLNYDSREQRAAASVLKSKWISLGRKTEEFENNFAKYLGNRVYCVALSSGTAAIHLSLLAHGIGKGDEVITSSLTFVACLNVITLVGAKPVLADCSSFEDWNISPQDVVKKITPRTRAIIAVHYAGYPCKMDELVSIAKSKNLILIEDTAHAVGASYKGIKCGTIGDLGIFSFFANKNLSVGEGGMIVTKNKHLYNKIKFLRSHGMTSMTIDRYRAKSVSYDVVMPGLNYRIDEIRSAFGIEQLKKLDKGNFKRKILTKRYYRILSGIKDIVLPWVDGFKHEPSYHILPLLLPLNINRDLVVKSMKKRGIQTSIHYPAFDSFSYYRHLLKEKCECSDQISQRVLVLPLYPLMKTKDVDYVCDCLRKSLNEQN